MRIARNVGLSLSLLLAGASTSAHAQTKPEVVDLFATRNVRTLSSTPRIPGMLTEAIGAVSVFPISPAGRRSLRSARAGAPKKYRIALPNASTVVCNVTPKRLTRKVLAMHGGVDDDNAFDNNAFGHCNLYEENGRITGDIDAEVGRYTIVPVAKMHAIVEVKTQEFPDEGELKIPPGAAPPTEYWDDRRACDVPSRRSRSGAPEKLGTLRILLMLTRTARARLGRGVVKVEDTLKKNLELAFKTANFEVVPRFVGKFWEVPYDEPHYSAGQRAMYSRSAGGMAAWQ